MNQMMKKIGVIMLAVLLAAMLAACAGGGGSGSSGSGSGGSGGGGGSSSGGDDILIGLSLSTLQEERWQRDRDLFIAKAEELGAEVIVQSADADEATQIAQSENMISQGVDVLVIVAHDGEAAATIVEKAHAEGIPVLAYDRLIMNADTDLYVTFDNVKVGELQAQAVVDVQPTGKYVYIGGSDTDNNAYQLKEGSMKVLQPLIDKGDIEIVYDQFSPGWDPAIAMANMENALTANNNEIDAVVAANDGTAGGVIQALAAQGMAGKVPVSGQDAELAAVQRIVEGLQTMTVYKPIKTIAERSAELAIQLAKGEEIKTEHFVNNGKIDVPSILLEPILVTKDNIDEVVIGDGFHSREDVYRNVE